VKDYEPGMSFGEQTAQSYDDGPRGDEDESVALLADLAGGRPALELAIGTGRIALPLAARGVSVEGVDIAPAMLARLREKPGGDAIPVTLGDFADVPGEGSYGLIYIVYNTFFNLLTQDEQVRCFENVAAHLDGGGSFLIEAFNPAYLSRLRDHQYVDARGIEVDQVWLEVARHDPVTQTLEKSHIHLAAGGLTLNPVVLRYAWPTEIDLMARLAGLTLKNRWGGWNREPFTASSQLHVSVYGT
jgi:Methyltransferase domain